VKPGADDQLAGKQAEDFAERSCEILVSKL
jgi:hypothetical protein